MPVTDPLTDPCLTDEPIELVSVASNQRVVLLDNELNPSPHDRKIVDDRRQARLPGVPVG